MKTLFTVLDYNAKKKILTTNKIKADKFVLDCMFKDEANFYYEKQKISNEKYVKLLWLNVLDE